MDTAVYYVEMWYWHPRCHIIETQALPERQPRGPRPGTGGGERNPDDRVGSETALVRGPVELDERRIDGGLVGKRPADQRRRDLAVNVPHCAEDTLTRVARRIPVSQLDRLSGAGRRARRHTGSGLGAVRQLDVHS